MRATHTLCLFSLCPLLLSAGRVDPSWTPRSLLDPEGYRSEDRNPGFIQIVEGANLFKIGSKYVLLDSVGDFVSRQTRVDPTHRRCA